MAERNEKRKKKEWVKRNQLHFSELRPATHAPVPLAIQHSLVIRHFTFAISNP